MNELWQGDSNRLQVLLCKHRIKVDQLQSLSVASIAAQLAVNTDEMLNDEAPLDKDR